MGSDFPKQYLSLNGQPVIEQTLERLLNVTRLKAIAIAIAADDERWQQLPLASRADIHPVVGGVERCHSVLNCLDYLAQTAADDDWVLVHDVARPCVEPVAIDQMIDRLKDHPVGGILALPVSDTVKQVERESIVATLDRSALWLAQTPQMFRLGPLRRALSDAIAAGAAITDEASAMERVGLQPVVVPGSVTNIKITVAQDIQMAEFISSTQAARGEER